MMLYPYKTVAAMKTIRYVVHPTELLSHWQGHRRLTRKVIEAFSEDTLFGYSINGMRPFSQIVMELLSISRIAINEIMGGHRQQQLKTYHRYDSKSDLLRVWDETTHQINLHWPSLRLEQFHETMDFLGMDERKTYEAIFFLIDHEVHHRGQGYVYLKALGITPPEFCER